MGGRSNIESIGFDARGDADAYRVRSGAVKRRPERVVGAPVFVIQIEIAIGIEIGPVVLLFFTNVVSSSARAAEYFRDAVEFHLAMTAFLAFQRFDGNQDFLNRSALKGRATGNLEILASVRISGLAVAPAMFSGIDWLARSRCSRAGRGTPLSPSAFSYTLAT